ncbi:quinolinate synthase [Candidatus Atribacteria bacterium RBG_19FT_COMBO_35_14]|uniref:Quinolinate synthase n=1 Tax=Candidatus Sediminicultor quintus TaxID=1797291 RepID=A0A1F5ACG3_9BACT|nr:MAG: quinolinate synthase [Candidatus Atribacteria bacterium RBG_19FT_COMBO_35_14]OGD36203.1 MAG: quinolinate synthase [Candidatus Atribacteria bacterium RBG_16_35_8]
MNNKTDNPTEKKLVKEILSMKKKRGAVILAHVYQPGEIQDIADFTGDSLFLSQQAAKTQAKVIVFCGVRFMAETASILSPEKIVLLPEINAGCPLADMAPSEKVKSKIKELPEAVVVSYVNSSAVVKSLSDYCCTSANAVQIAQSIPAEKEILFLPDMNLADFTAKKAKRKIIPWPGFCPTHHLLTREDVIKAKKLHPQALLLVHPECRPEVCDLADYIGSTRGIIEFASNNPAKEYIIGTELGIFHPLKKNNPNKKFFPASENMICRNMKLITLEKVLYSLQNLEPLITVPEEISKKSLKALNRMIEIT